MKTAFYRCHPAVNLVYFLAVAVLGLLFLHPAFLAVSFTAALSYCLLLEGKSGIRRILALLPLQAAVMLFNTGFAHYGVTPLCTLPGGNRITLEAVVFGAVMGVVVITMLLWFRCFSLVVTEDRFFCVLGKGFPQLSLLLLLILRFLPLLQQRLRAASDASRALGDETKRTRLRSAAAALSGTVSYTLEHAVDTADVMRARGFGLRGRRSYARFRFRMPDGLLLGALALGFAGALAARFGGLAAASYNPVISIAPLTPPGVAALIVYALLCFAPQLCGLVAVLRWLSGRCCMKRILPLLLMLCLLVCTACGTRTQPDQTTAAAVSVTTQIPATTAGSGSALTSLQTSTAPSAAPRATSDVTTAGSTTAPHTTAPHTTHVHTTLLTTLAATTHAATTRRIYTTTPFTTKAKVRPTTTRPAATTTAAAAAPDEDTTAPDNATTRVKAHTCTVSISCSVLLENSGKLKPGKAAFVPTGGQILVPTTVTFTPGEDAYTVLRRACAENVCVDRCPYCAKDGIQMEAAFTPGYNTYYVQGIHQIYEKDCGAKSGWLYRVNGVYPNVGSSSCTVQDGDRIEWIYTLEPVM